MLVRIEVGELFHPVEDVRDEFLQEQAWDDANAAAETASDRTGEFRDLSIIHVRSDSLCLR